MQVLSLVLLLAAGSADGAPNHDLRAGGGGTGFVDVEGIAPTAELGVEVARGERLGLRFTFGTALRVGWGSVFLSPELVWRAAPRHARLSPYVTAGLQAAALNITKRARGLPEFGEARSAASSTPVDGLNDPSAGGGPIPMRLSAGPQAGLGVTVPALGTTFDLGLRYNLHFWKGDAYSGLGLVLTVVGPMGF
jgi:hypothetical protein